MAVRVILLLLTVALLDLKFYSLRACSTAEELQDNGITSTTPTTVLVEEILSNITVAVEAIFNETSSRREVFSVWSEQLEVLNGTIESSVAPNEFAYYKPEELATYFTGFTLQEGIKPKYNRMSYPRRTLGSAIEPPVWTGTGTPPDNVTLLNWDELFPSGVKDQGFCGACYAFAAAHAIEMEYMRANNGSYQDCSEQQMIACPITLNGCLGGDHRQVFALNMVRRKFLKKLDSSRD